MLNNKTYVVCFLLGGLVSLLVTPYVISLAEKVGAIDKPGNRKIHDRPVPLLGGLAIGLGVWIPILMLMAYENRVSELVWLNFDKLAMVFVAGLAMFALGVVDDIRGLDAKKKFLVQTTVAVLLVLGGIKFKSVTLPFLGGVDLGFLGYVISVLWIVGITNAFNLVDGVDGLAAGIAFFAALTTAVIGVVNGNVLMAVVMCSLAGACLGFLRYNFKPAKIFLGDTGSLSIGMTMAVCSMLCSQKGTVATSILIPIVALGYPISDTFFAMLRRALRGRSMFSGDNGHIHHRLLRLGLDHRKVAFMLYGVSILFCAIALGAVFENMYFVGVGLAILLAVSGIGFHYLGFTKLLSPESLKRERRQFKVLYKYAEYIKAKIEAATTFSAVFDALIEACKEFGKRGIKICLPENVSGKAFEIVWEPKQGIIYETEKNKSNGVEKDVYKYDDTGLVVNVYYSHNGNDDEWDIEKRNSIGMLIESANRQIKSIINDTKNGKNGDVASMEKKGSPTEKDLSTDKDLVQVVEDKSSD